jgi:hypothetical protein
MAMRSQTVLLAIDDDPLDLEALDRAWTAAGFAKFIRIDRFPACDQAIGWIDDEATRDALPVGILVDARLFDRAGHWAVETLGRKGITGGIPLIAWSDGDWRQEETYRVMKSGGEAWRKPCERDGYGDFAKRLHERLMRG